MTRYVPAEPLRRSLRGLARDRRVWLATGTISRVEHDAEWGVRLFVTAYVPDKREVEARPAYPGNGSAGGDFPVFAEDDEVLLFFPGGDLNAALAMHGPVSQPQRPQLIDTAGLPSLPSLYQNDKHVVTSVPVHFWKPSDGIPRFSREVLLRPALADLAGVLEALSNMLTALNTAFTPPGTVNAANISTLLNTSRTVLSASKTTIDAMRTNIVADLANGGPYLSNAILSTHDER